MKKLLIVIVLFWLPVANGMNKENGCTYCSCPRGILSSLNAQYLATMLYAQQVLVMSQDKRDEELCKHVEASQVKGDHQKKHCAMTIVGLANPNNPKINGMILHGGILENHFEFVKFLLEHKMDPNTCNEEGIPALFYADNREMAALLVAHGADVKRVQKPEGVSLFGYAVIQHTNPESINLLSYYLEQGVDMNNVDDKENTALHLLADQNNWIYKSEKVQKNFLDKARLLLKARISLKFNKRRETAQQLLDNFISGSISIAKNHYTCELQKTIHEYEQENGNFLSCIF